MNLNSRRLRDVTIFAAVIMGLQIVLSNWVYPMFGQTTQQLYSISPQTALTSTSIGDKVISAISGIIPTSFDVPSLITMFIGAWLLVFVGFLVYDQRWSFKGKNESQKVGAILFYGTAVLYVALLVLKWSSVAQLSVSLALGLIINYAIIAFIYAGLAKRVNILRV